MASAAAPGRHTPANPKQAAALLRECSAAGGVVRIAGGGTKSGWGNAGAEPAVELSTAGLTEVVEHNEGDLTAVVQAGLRLADLRERLARSGQMLALDPPLGAGGAATVGGIIAAGDSGPLRHRHGAARDLVLGMTVALSDGVLAQSGGKVIKNVAGYDLAKLFTGAFGTLGLIVQVAVRLHPLPPATATASGATDDAGRLADAAGALAHSALELQALDVRWDNGRGTVLARFAGAAAADQAADAERTLAGLGMEAGVPADDAELWERQRAAQRAPEGVVVRVSGLPSQLPEACAAAAAAGGTLVGRAALGLSWIALPVADTAALVEGVARVRTALAPAPCVVLDAPAPVRAALDPWSRLDDPGQVLMGRVKERFDPTATCNRGVFVGGI